MDGVSGASAIASLILGAKIATQVQSFVEKVQKAPQDVKDIASNLRTIVSVLRQLENALKDPGHRPVFNSLNKAGNFSEVTDAVMGVFILFSSLGS